MADMTATARIPCRPLSYENKDIAYPKEVLVDYNTGSIYICKTDGTFTDVTGQNTISQIQEALGYYVDEDGNVQFDLLNKIAIIDPETGEVTITISSADILESDDKQFVSAAEKAKWDKATYPEIIKTIIKGGESYWSGTEAPYTQQVSIDGILETDVPVIDISLSDIYDTVQKQLDNYAYIYKIITYNGYIVVYASEPTTDDITIQMKVDR